MKRLLVLSLFLAMAAEVQALPAAAANASTVSSGVTNSSVNNLRSAPGAVGVPSVGSGNFDRANTAPTKIPEDTTLMKTPSANPIRQSQEEFNSFPDSTVAPGTGSGPNSGSGTMDNKFNPPYPVTSP